VVAGSCTNEYQGGQLPSNNYRALPWWLDTAVNDTNQKKAYRSEPWKLRKFLIVCAAGMLFVGYYWKCHNPQELQNASMEKRIFALGSSGMVGMGTLIPRSARTIGPRSRSKAPIMG